MIKSKFSLLLFVTIILGSCKDGDDVVLKNQYVAFTFKKGSYSLTGLTDLTTKKEHIIPDSSANELWKLSFSKDEKIISISNNLSQPGKGDIVKNNIGGQSLRILWDNLGLPELKDVKVEVVINLPEKSGIADWHINVINESKEWGLWEVNFPRVSGLLDSCNYDVYGSFGNRNGRSESWGALYKGYHGRLDLLYPDGWGNMSMQFIGANSGSNGVYMATHDPRAWRKSFVIEPGKEFYIKVNAENMGIAGSGFNDPFSFMFGVFQGDWLTAAKIYRKFAITAPWVAKGKVSEATSTPQSFKDVALWFRGWNYPVSDPVEYKRILETWKKAKEFFGVPLGLHWYNWNIYPFDTHYPHFSPAKKGVKEFTHQLTDMGVVVMPYINGRIVDKANEDISEFLPYAAKKSDDGSTYEEIYGNGKPQMVMCPTSIPYQDTIVKTIERLADETGVNSVYIDQIAAAPSNLCFDKSHGHPLGGGSYWIDGYRQMLGKVQKIAHGNGRDLSITSECTAEPYMDSFDGYLMVNPRSDKSIPLLPAVYSGYAIYFASWEKSMSLTDSRFIAILGRDVLWGCKPGWFSLDKLFDPQNEKKLDYFRTLGRAHYSARKYFVYGEFLKQFESEEKSEETKMPLQMCTVWRAEDGSIALVIANFTEEEAFFPVDVKLSDYVLDNRKYRKTYDLIKNAESEIKIKDIRINENVALKPLEIKIIEIAR